MPEGPTAGVDLKQLRGLRNGVIAVTNTAGTGTLTVTLRCWGYATSLAGTSSGVGVWLPVKMAHDSTSVAVGYLGNGNPLTEIGTTDCIRHSEPMPPSLHHFTRVFFQKTNISPASLAVSVSLISSD